MHKKLKSALKQLRSDARRNRDQLLAAAVEAFTRDPAASLEGIARAAGVGIGTLYRHYPTRDALLEAVFRSAIESLCAVGSKLHAKHAPDVALSRFLDLVLDHTLSNPGMVQAIRAVSTVSGTMNDSRALLASALEPIVEAGRAQGLLRTDITVEDVLVATAAVVTSPPKHARRLARILLDGLRSPTARAATQEPGKRRKGEE